MLLVNKALYVKTCAKMLLV